MGGELKREKLKVAKRAARNRTRHLGYPMALSAALFTGARLPLEDYPSDALRIVVDGLRGMFLDKRVGKLVAAREHIAEVLRFYEVPLAQLKLGEV